MQITTSLIGSSSSESLLKLIQGDTRPNLIVNLSSQTNSNVTPLNVNTATCLFKLRKVKTTQLLDTILCVPLPGLENSDGSITFTAPYDQLGAGGRILVAWNPNSLAVAGTLEGEVEVTFADGTIQTAYNVARMIVRSQF